MDERSPVNIREIFNRLQTQEQAIDYLEKVRWNGKPICPYCGSDRACRHASGDRASGRWQCEDCHRAYSVMIGTIFHGTHLPLRKWFLLLALTLDTNKSLTSSQIARDLGMRRPTVSNMMRRVREAIEGDAAQGKLLYGIVGTDGKLGTKDRKQSGKLTKR